MKDYNSLLIDMATDLKAQISLFYLVFCGVIFSLFTFKMWITLQYIYQMDDPYVFVSKHVRTSFDRSYRMPLLARSSEDGLGLSFKPNVLTPMTSPIIWISKTNTKAEPTRYIQALNKFFERYIEKKLPHTSECGDSHTEVAVNSNKPCFFNISVLGQCSKPPYGYTTEEPCVIIAFNKMFHWVPYHYNATSDLPSAMPDWLKKLVRQATKPNIWFSCAGANQVDNEYLGEILYIPQPGFPVAYFPYTGNKYHMSPLIAVQFKNVTVNRLLTVECTAWARNINVRNGYSMDFQIMIGVVGLFYLVFFSVLAVLCAICYRGLMLTINLKRPKWILEDSLIGTSPGLGFRPISEDIDEGSLIWYNATNATEVAAWTKRIDKFLDAYINSSLLPTEGRNQQFCSDTHPMLPGKVCFVDLNGWDDCSPGGSYGYNNSAPCFFIKLNKIYGWEPIYYDNGKSLPSDMPETLTDYIKSTNDSTLNTVWVTCDGQSPADREMIGDIEYYPKIGGFPGFYFPYTNIPGYLSPLVAVHFLRPRRNVIINVECRAWAQNIRYSDRSHGREGSVHFAFMIDD